jgi:hypothetical protein
MPPHGSVRSFSFFFIFAFYRCQQDLTGQVSIALCPEANYRWKIGAGASTDVYMGERKPQGVIGFLFSAYYCG